MAGFSIDPDTFRQAADQLDAGKEEVQALFEQFMSALEQFADAFGGDEIGMLLGLAHQAVAEALSECFTTNIADLEDYAVSLREMADGHQNTDDEIASIFQSLLGEVEA